MIFRRVKAHIEKENWFAVFIDFLIVVVGILIAFQITNWSEERAERDSERDFLDRLHSDILELQERRAEYDLSRPEDMKTQIMITEFLYGESEDLSTAEAFQIKSYPGIEKDKGLAASIVCNMIDWTSALTVPPAALPTATELISAGRVNDIVSTHVKAALQTFLQQANRAEVYINALEKDSILLSAHYPELIEVRTKKWTFELNGENFSNYRCNYEAMRSNGAFLNAFALNVGNYSNYAIRGVLPVSEKLALLHDAVDDELGLSHENDQEAK